MATRDPSDTRAAAHYCWNCAAALHGASFCPQCGSAIAPIVGPDSARRFEQAGGEAAARRRGPEPQSDVLPLIDDAVSAAAKAGAPDSGSAYSAPTDGAPPRGPVSTQPHGLGALDARPPRRRRRLLVGLATLLVALIVAGGATAIVLVSSSGDTSSSYRQNLTEAFAPVISANRSLSDSLTSLHGSDTSAAQHAVSQAQSATSSARGALGALAAPAASQPLASQSRQVLDREDSYLTAISAVLTNPSSPSVSQLQGLSGNLTAAFDAVGGPLAGASASISGADTLTNWAQRSAHPSHSQPPPSHPVYVPVPVPTPSPTPPQPASGQPGTVTGTDGSGFNVGVNCSDNPSNPLPGCNDGNGRGPSDNLSYGSVTGTDSQGYNIGVGCSDNASSSLPSCSNG